MLTVWGENLNKENILGEYPRPQMVRESYLNLNGIWKYAITDTDIKPPKCDGEILVPFSPESELSGVKHILQPNETLWYERELVLPEGFHKPKGRIILHFGAVDQECKVYLNAKKVCEHKGGYTSFEVDITDYLYSENILSVKVKDLTDTSYHSCGKQKLNPGGIWYTPQSGIWQSVWLECVPEEYIKGLKITPDFDNKSVSIVVLSDSYQTCLISCGDVKASGMSGEPITLQLDDVKSWSPEEPNLYDFSVRMDKDTVNSYFAMRKFEVREDSDGIKKLFLNNKPYFHNGILDQGYWPDGLYTAPSDEALKYDLKLAKCMGFNMLRKHIKVEPMRWYYHCDKIGMLVWQDMINGGTKYKNFNITHPLFTGINRKDNNYKYFSREDEAGRSEYYEEICEIINQLYNAASIAMWVPFNEGWGQFDAYKTLLLIQSMDRTRTVDHASGWHDQKIGDFSSKHVYFKKYRFKKDKLKRAVILSEFGGYKCRIDGHTSETKEFGYKKTKSKEEFAADYKRLYENEIIPAIKKGLTATVYTQLSDVEGEINGFTTYDRKAEKLSRTFAREINKKIYAAFNGE